MLCAAIHLLAVITSVLQAASFQLRLLEAMQESIPWRRHGDCQEGTHSSWHWETNCQLHTWLFKEPWQLPSLPWRVLQSMLCWAKLSTAFPATSVYDSEKVLLAMNNLRANPFSTEEGRRKSPLKNPTTSFSSSQTQCYDHLVCWSPESCCSSHPSLIQILADQQQWPKWKLFNETVCKSIIYQNKV